MWGWTSLLMLHQPSYSGIQGSRKILTSGTLSSMEKENLSFLGPTLMYLQHIRQPPSDTCRITTLTMLSLICHHNSGALPHTWIHYRSREVRSLTSYTDTSQEQRSAQPYLIHGYIPGHETHRALPHTWRNHRSREVRSLTSQNMRGAELYLIHGEITGFRGDYRLENVLDPSLSFCRTSWKGNGLWCLKFYIWIGVEVCDPHHFLLHFFMTLGSCIYLEQIYVTTSE